jgi:uncharacterized protein
MQLLTRDATHHPTFGGYGLAVWLTNLVGMNEVAIVGPDEGRTSMERVAWEAFRPDVVIASSNSADSVVPLLAGRTEDTATKAYVCRNLVCDLPVGSAEELGAKLRLDTVLD